MNRIPFLSLLIVGVLPSLVLSAPYDDYQVAEAQYFTRLLAIPKTASKAERSKIAKAAQQAIMVPAQKKYRSDHQAIANRISRELNVAYEAASKSNQAKRPDTQSPSETGGRGVASKVQTTDTPESVVVDGSNVPKELQFKGSAKKKPSKP